jgi:hypothetical protein
MAPPSLRSEVLPDPSMIPTPVSQPPSLAALTRSQRREITVES